MQIEVRRILRRENEREWMKLAALRQGIFRLLVTCIRLRFLKGNHHASVEKYCFSAGFEPATLCFIDRCSTNELACNFPSIAWCKVEGGRLRQRTLPLLIRGDQQFGLHDLFDH